MQEPVHQSDLSLVRLTAQVRLIKLQRYWQQGHPTQRRFSSTANAANVQLGTHSRRGEEKDNGKYISVEHAMNKSEMGKEMQRERH